VDPDGKEVDPLARSEERLKEYQLYASNIIPRLPDYGNILDLGAGTGLMLSLFPKRYRRLAVEPNSIAAQKARERGLEVVEDFAENLSFLKEPLALIICNQSLDHFMRPDIILGRLLNLLAPGGLVLLTGLINPESLAAKITGPMFRLWHPYHQVYPPRQAVLDKLTAYGLTTISVWKPYFNTPYGSLTGLCKGAFILAKAFIRRGSTNVPSPAWPGNTLSYLARKELLVKPIKVPDGDAALPVS
jgi:SAM-dependent methyltransferase